MVFNNGVDPQLRIMERLGDMTAAACSENLRIPLAVDGRDISLGFHSKGDCIGSCMHSHVPVQGQNRAAVLRYIRINREIMDPSSKRKFYDGVDQVSHGGHWKRSRRNGTRNSEVQNHGNGAGFGGR